MPNPLFKTLGGAPKANANFAQMVRQFNQFAANFQGDPKAEVQKLLQSGKMSQQQLDQLQAVAAQFRQLL